MHFLGCTTASSVFIDEIHSFHSQPLIIQGLSTQFFNFECKIKTVHKNTIHYDDSLTHTRANHRVKITESVLPTWHIFEKKMLED